MSVISGLAGIATFASGVWLFTAPFVVAKETRTVIHRETDEGLWPTPWWQLFIARYFSPGTLLAIFWLAFRFLFL